MTEHTAKDPLNPLEASVISQRQSLLYMQNSLSWKLTSPIRSIRKRFQKQIPKNQALNLHPEKEKIIIKAGNINFLEQELLYMQNSLSWKITAPMRFLVRYLKQPLKSSHKLRTLHRVLHGKKANDENLSPEYEFNLSKSLPIKTRFPDTFVSDVLDHRASNVSAHNIDIISFPIIDWSFRFQRPQQLMCQFAAHNHRVFYLSFDTGTNTFQKGQDFIINEILSNIYIVTLNIPIPDIYGEVLSDEVKEKVIAALQLLRKTYHIECAISFVMLTSWTDVAFSARAKWGWRTIYDCMDEWDTFPGIKKPLIEKELTLVQECDLLVVTAKNLYDKWKDQCQSITLAYNAADYAFYEKNCFPNALLTNLKSGVVGYYGAIAEWFDIELAVHIAKERPELTFIYIGGVFNVDISELEALPNVQLLGQQNYELMPKYLYHFDVCIIPFKINKITEATDPVKLYEYFCKGKPVVSVALPEVAKYKEHLYIGIDKNDFLTKLDEAIKENDINRSMLRESIAKQNSWEQRYQEIMDTYVKVVPLVSIIVVTYNNIAYNKLCIESIFKNTEYPHYEIIVVDNKSSDGTPTYLRFLAKQHKNLRIILNKENYGFAKANNQGLEIARGEYLVLLNNDTIVPNGWLDRLVWHLKDPNIGMVGPSTNQVGNESKIEIPYNTISEMEKFAKELTWKNEDQISDISMLAMFCVAMRREVFEKVGPLDEQFGIGMFEDDDYSHRVKLEGYRVIWARDVFVHHFGQTSFIKLIDNGGYNPLFEKNKLLFETKWNVKWSAHQPKTLTTDKTLFLRNS